MEGIAYKSMCSGFGLWIDEIIHGTNDYVIFHYTNDKKHTVKIYYTQDGRAYFNAWGEKHYFDEFIKTNI